MHIFQINNLNKMSLNDQTLDDLENLSYPTDYDDGKRHSSVNSIQLLSDSDDKLSYISEKKKINNSAVTNNIINEIFNCNMILIPMVFKLIGIIPAIIFFHIVYFIEIRALRSALKCKDITKNYGCEIYARICFGPKGKQLVKILYIMRRYLLCVLYLTIIGRIIYNMVIFLLPRSKIKYKIFFYDKTYTFIFFIISLPFNFKYNISVNRMFNLKIFFYIIFILILVYLLIDKAIHHKLLFPSKKLLFGDFCYENYIYGFSIILFFMTFQKIIFEVYVLMKSRKNKNMIKSTKKGLLISIYMFIFLGTLFTITLNGSYETYTEFLFKEITGINKLLYKVFLASILSTVLIFFVFSYFNNFVRLRKQFYSLFLYRKKHELFEYKTTKEFTEIKMENVKMKHEKIKLSFCDKIFVTFLMIIFISIMINYSNKIIVLITFFGAFSSNIIILFLPTSYLIILNNVKIFSKEMIVEKIIMLIGLFILCFIIYIYITFIVNKFI